MGKFSRDWKEAQYHIAELKKASNTPRGKQLQKAIDEGTALMAEVDKLVARYESAPTEAMVKALTAAVGKFSGVVAKIRAMEAQVGIAVISAGAVKQMDTTLSAMADLWVDEWKPVRGGTVFKAAGPWTRDWQDAKKAFEAKTKRKKPSRTILGAFRMSSGIEKALSTCEGLALKLASDPDDKTSAKLKAARADMRRATAGYVAELRKARSGDADADPVYAEQLVVLAKALEDIADSLDTACEAAEEKWQVAPYDVKRAAAALAAAQAAVKAAASKVEQARKSRGDIDAKLFQKHLTEPTKAVAAALLALQKLAVGGGAPRSVLTLPLQQVQIYGNQSYRDVAKGKSGSDPVRALLETAEDFYDRLDTLIDKAGQEWRLELARVGRSAPY